MNLAELGRSRRRPMVGDIFVMRPPDGRFLFGRVVSTNANPLGVGGAVLVYVYRVRSKTAAPPPTLPLELLLPPFMTNQLPWTRGYFKFVDNRQLTSADVFPTHCFMDSRGYYYDESGTQLPGPTEPVGQWSLRSFRTIDEDISEALGISNGE